MSIFRPTLGEKQAIERQGLALWSRIRQNFWLKVISLVAAILLYFFVQQERNPTVPRTFMAQIVLVNGREDVEVERDMQQFEVTLSGPRPIIDSLKDGDVRLVADLGNLPTDKVTTERVPMTYDIRLPEELKRELRRDPDPLPPLKVQLYPQLTILRNVEVHFVKETPVGVKYGRAILRPDKVKVTGRADRIARVERVVVEASTSDPGTEIDGEFPLSARDRDNNTVIGVTLSAQKAQVRIPLEIDDYSKIVSISPNLFDLPEPPYRLVEVRAEPSQVRIVGRPENVNPITTLTTDPISVHDLTEDQTIEARLTPANGVTIRDLKGNAISKVKVRITIGKVSAPTTSGQPASHPDTNAPQSSGKTDTHP
ncbi:MAG TPA: CdaR family protein [Chthonomonadaceae bacterium]|nr:CdaR family protein [Chthonomonadaceae bacterium]